MLWANDKRRISADTKADTSRSNPLNLRTGVSGNSCWVLHPHFHCLAALCVGFRRREVVTKSDAVKVIAHVVGGWWEQHIFAFCLGCVTRCNPVLWQDSVWRVLFSFMLLLSNISQCFFQKKNRALLGYYAASSGNFLPTFRDNLSVPSSGWRIQKKHFFGQWIPEDGAAEVWNHTNLLFSFALSLGPSTWNFWTFGERICIKFSIGHGTVSPISVAALTKAWVFGRSLAEIAGSIAPWTEMSFCCECCVLSCRGLCVGPITCRGILPRVCVCVCVCVSVLLSLIWKPKRWGGLGPSRELRLGKKRKLYCLVIRYQFWLTLSGKPYCTSNACVSAPIWSATRCFSEWTPF